MTIPKAENKWEEAHHIDWEHVAFLSVVLAFIIWYLSDSISASPTFSNLILIAPVGAIAFILATYLAITEILHMRGARAAQLQTQTDTSAEAASSRFREGSLQSVVLLIALFGAFVLAIPYAGFDVASFLFIVATMWMLGERRAILTLSLAIGVSGGISIVAITLLTFPMPLGIARYMWRAF